MAALIASCRETTRPASDRRMDVCSQFPPPARQESRTFHLETDHASPIGLNLTQPPSANNRPLVTLTIHLKRLRLEDLAFLKLAIFPAIRVSSSLFNDL